MAFIFGVATQEADLYKILRDFLGGFATPGQVQYSGQGNGTLNNLRFPEATSGVYETFTITCESTAPRGGTFSVTGSETGLMPTAVVGQVYRQPNVEFYLDFGPVDYQVGDQFIVSCMTGDPTKPRFRHLMGGPETGEETVTLECLTPEALNPYTPATFSVNGSESGGLPNLTQGEWYRNPYLNLLLAPAAEGARRYAIGDTLTIKFSRNPLRKINQHWEILRRELATDNSLQQFGREIVDGDVELIMRGPGMSQDQSVFWGMRRGWNDASAMAVWTHYGMAGYIPSMAIGEQPDVQGGQSGTRPIHTFWGLTIPYVIIASGRCFKLLTRSNIYYSQSYQGLILPSSMPKYYGYPYFSGGTGTTSNTMWSNLHSTRAAFWNYTGPTSETSALVYNPSRSWTSMLGDASERNGSLTTEYTTNGMYPHYVYGMYDLRTNLDDSVPLFPVQLYPNRGQLDGVYAVPGRDGRQPEEILVNRDGSRAYVVQNHHRSGFNDFAAFTLE